MGNPDMTDESAVVRARAQLIAPGADHNIQIVGDESPRALADRVVAAVQARMEHDDATYDVIYPSNLVQSAFEAMSESGYALVRLPEPDHGDGAAAYWETDTDTICASITAHGRPFVDVVGENFCFADMGEGRAYFTAGLAACDHAERLADEHNTAAQDAEGASRG